ncbi:MAG: casein kinase 1 family protein [archaeon]|nr:casein kinase 1 family protein [archaeon]
MSDPKLVNKVFFEKYLCQKKIGKGSFGTVYEGINTKTNEKIAFKLEKRDKSSSGTLETEAYRLLYLQGEGVPKIYCYGNNSTYNILIQELLGDSLDTLFNKSYKKFSLKTVCVLGIEMINRIKWIHAKHHIHRDIKPDNFTIGRDNNANKIYIIDFGLSKKYFSDSKQKHIKFCKGKSLTGTARYCGRHAHLGYEQSRRDDIESIGYVLMYFLLGQLPWQGLKVKPGEDHFDVIAKKKIHTSFEELCRNQPEEFLFYFKHADKLEFEEEPDYEYLIGLFQSVINKHCADCNYDFDWNKLQCNYLPTLNQSSMMEDKMNKSRDVSLFVNKNNNTSAISVESASKDINGHKGMFLNETGANISFDMNCGVGGGAENPPPQETKPKQLRTKPNNRKVQLEVSIQEEDDEYSHKKKKPGTAKHKTETDKKRRNKCRSLPKNLEEETHESRVKKTLSQKANESPDDRKDISNLKTMSRSNKNNIEEQEQSITNEKGNIESINQTSKEGINTPNSEPKKIEEKEINKDNTNINNEDIQKNQNQTNKKDHRKMKRSNSDDFNRLGGEKDKTACGCIII